VPSKQVQEFEKNYHVYMAEKHKAVLDEIRTTKNVSDAARAAMDAAIKAVKAQMQIGAKS